MINRRSHRWILGIFMLFLIGAILFEPSYGWKLRQFLSPSETGQTDPGTLAAENASLKAQIALLGTIASEVPQKSQKEIRAMVYSRYPLNFKNEILVNVGAEDGVATGSAALFQGMLLGRVVQVFPKQSLIQTVFDSAFQMPVRIGASSFDGLFEGGTYPRVGSIAKSAPLQLGDIIYTAAPGLPYGLPVGELRATSTSPDSLFEEASVAFPYDINNIQTVLIVIGT